jgi:IS30 family transposase
MSSKEKFLSLEERIKVLKKLDEGQPIRKIAEEFKCGKTQITNIRDNKDSLKRQWEDGRSEFSETYEKMKNKSRTFEQRAVCMFAWNSALISSV